MLTWELHSSHQLYTISSLFVINTFYFYTFIISIVTFKLKENWQQLIWFIHFLLYLIIMDDIKNILNLDQTEICFRSPNTKWMQKYFCTSLSDTSTQLEQTIHYEWNSWNNEIKSSFSTRKLASFLNTIIFLTD